MILKRYSLFFVIAFATLTVLSCGRQDIVPSPHLGFIELHVTAASADATNATKASPISYSRTIEVEDENVGEHLFLHEYVTGNWQPMDGVSASQMTKGYMVTAGSANNALSCGHSMVQEFHVEAFFAGKPSDELLAEYPTGCYFSDTAVYDSLENRWYFANGPYKWPGCPLRFWACYPGNLADPSRSDKVVYEDGVNFYDSRDYCMTLEYDVPGTKYDDENIDVLLACGQADAGRVPIGFMHALSAITFKDNSEEGLNIKSVALRGISSGAELCYDDERNITWGNHTDGTSYSMTVAEGDSISDPGYVFFVTPQVLKDGASVVLTYEDNNGLLHERVAYINKTGGNPVEWRAGYKYTYRLSVSQMEWKYVVEPMSDVEFDWYGGWSDEMEVVSYRMDVTNPLVKEILPVAMEYSTDGGLTWTGEDLGISLLEDKGDEEEEEEDEYVDGWLMLDFNCRYDDEDEWQWWIQEHDYSADFAMNAKYVCMPVCEVSDEVVARHAAALRSNSVPSSSTSPYDLSMYDIYGVKRSKNCPVTANSYVVRAPGYYMLPIVYGNAVDFTRTSNGVNTTAFAPAYKGEEPWRNVFLNHFQNYRNEAIASPFIEEDLGCSAQTACLVWQDVTSPIVRESSLRIVDAPSSAPSMFTENGCRYLAFRIEPQDIKQGNVVLAIKDASGDVMWSWHIWVTDDNLSMKSVASSQNGIVTSALPVNLGWCEGPAESSISEQSRSIQVKFYQFENGQRTKAECIMTVKQNANCRISFPQGRSGNNPFYQWGRKDPMLPMMGGYDVRNKPFLAGSGFVVANGDYQIDAVMSTSSTLDFASSIKHPATLYYTDVDNDYLRWYYGGVHGRSNSIKTNLWDAERWARAGHEGVPSIKTVYDPCPPGFMVPNEISLDVGSYIYDYGSIENSVAEAVSHGGWSLYCMPDRSETIFIPFVLSRNVMCQHHEQYGGRGISSWAPEWGGMDFSTLYFGSHASELEYYFCSIDIEGAYWDYKIEDYACSAASIRPMAEPEASSVGFGNIDVNDWTTGGGTNVNF